VARPEGEKIPLLVLGVCGPQVGCLVAGTSLANKYPLKPLYFFQVVFRFVPVVFSTCFSLGDFFNAVIRSIVSSVVNDPV
jgi:hypothetical protein